MAAAVRAGPDQELAWPTASLMKFCLALALACGAASLALGDPVTDEPSWVGWVGTVVPMTLAIRRLARLDFDPVRCALAVMPAGALCWVVGYALATAWAAEGMNVLAVVFGAWLKMIA